MNNVQAIAAAVALALAAALAAWGWSGEKKAQALGGQLTAMRAQRDAALGSAQACSASVQALADAGALRASAAEPARQQAEQRARQHAQRANAILAAPPAVPEDDAASARHRIDAWLRGRGQ